MTLRQILNRIRALDADSPFAHEWRSELEKAEERQRAAEHDDVLNRYKPKGATDA